MKAREIRARFLKFFEQREHQIVASGTLVPQDDPTLLFTNAGMNQFKSVFLGLEHRDYQRATSVQKCMRVSGKHNDLEEVGKDARHHTLFEMLGNWSFGDYYKRESIAWGWEFLTVEMGLPVDKLWVSVYKDDNESYDLWAKEMGISPDRLVRLGDLAKGDEENFWSMADTGPCGPCTEIHFDQGEEMKCDHPKGCEVGVCDCDRWLELWNHVFMEFDRDEKGTLNPLPMKSVDTGLGFERLVAVMQGKKSNYETDLFVPLINKVAEICGHKPEGEARISMQVIADHARAVVFTITDGAIPSNEGRGYVVRRILRRAARHGHLLGLEKPFLWQISDLVISEMSDAYPELAERRERVLDVIRQEEERFGRTLVSGLVVYSDFKKRMLAEGRTSLTGEEAFKLHDTYGFPVDLTAVVAEEDGLTVDRDGFVVCMEKQRKQSRKENKFMAGIGVWQIVDPATSMAGYKSKFTGYDSLENQSQVVAIRAAGQTEDGSDQAHLLFNQTPFYAESGGQAGDIGTISIAAGGDNLSVLGTIVSEEGSVCVVAGKVDQLLEIFKANSKVTLSVDKPFRLGVRRHHTATHLLHSALRQVLGDHVEQAGSVVQPDRLRFDFSHDKGLSDAEVAQVEALVNGAVLANRAVISHSDVAIDDAKKRGATALFGEKYGDKVRVVEINEGYLEFADQDENSGPMFSIELCGGTHCLRTGDVGMFRIVSEGSVAAGVRRVEAVSGSQANDLIRDEQQQLSQLGTLLRADGGSYADQVQSLIDERQQMRRELARLQQDSARASLEDTLASPRDISGVQVISASVPAEDKNSFMQLGDHVRDRLGSNGVVVLAADIAGKPTLLVTVTDDLVKAKRLHAGNLVKAIAEAAGGRGGGRPNMAQAGLPDAASLEVAIAAVDQVIQNTIG